MKAKLEDVESDSRLRLGQEVAGLGKQLAEYQTDSHTAQSSLSLRIQALEAQNAKVSSITDKDVHNYHTSCLCHHPT